MSSLHQTNLIVENKLLNCDYHQVNEFDFHPFPGLYALNHHVEFFQNSNLCFNNTTTGYRYLQNEQYLMKYRKCKDVCVCEGCERSKRYKNSGRCNCGKQTHSYGSKCGKKVYLFHKDDRANSICSRST